MATKWKIFVNEQWHGPYEAGEIAAWLAQGKVSGDTYVFAQGMEQAKMIREVPEIKTALQHTASPATPHDPYRPAQGTQDAASRTVATPKELWRSPVIVQIILIIVTLGIWQGVWFLVQKKGLNNLTTSDTMGSVGAVFVIICAVANLLVNSSSGYYFGLGGGPSPGQAPAIGLIVSLVFLYFLAIFSFGAQVGLTYKVRGMLVEHRKKPLAHVWPCIFGILYLQYAINRMVDGRE